MTSFLKHWFQIVIQTAYIPDIMYLRHKSVVNTKIGASWELGSIWLLYCFKLNKMGQANHDIQLHCEQTKNMFHQLTSCRNLFETVIV